MELLQKLLAQGWTIETREAKIFWLRSLEGRTIQITI